MKRTVFGGRILPWLLLAPQLLVTAIFFLWPAGQAVRQSFLREDPFGLSTSFVGIANYRALLASEEYVNSLQVTVVFSIAVAALSMGLSLFLATAADRVVRTSSLYTPLLVWPYAVAPAVAGILWWFIFNPTIGVLPYILNGLGYEWNHSLNRVDAMILVIVAASWKQISYNFLFFLAGLQAIPSSLHEAAAIDRAGPFKRFWTITFPLLAPTTFFLLVVNVVYTMFETFGIIHATTEGGPNQSTNILIYKVYEDAFLNNQFGSSAAQSVILMVIVIAMTMIQFRWIERRVEY